MLEVTNGIFKIEIIELKKHSLLVSSDSLDGAYEIANTIMLDLNDSNSTIIEKSFRKYIDMEKTTIINELSTEESLKIINQEDILYVDVNSTDLVNLASMFDPSDPGHTRGDSDYFIDQLTEMIIERPEDRTEIMKEILIIARYIRIIVSD